MRASGGFGSRVAKFQHCFCNTEFSPLRFTAQEAQAFFAHQPLQLTPAQVTTLHQDAQPSQMITSAVWIPGSQDLVVGYVSDATVSLARQSIGAKSADKDEARLLERVPFA